MKNVAVIGAGTMGCGIAQVLVSAGITTILTDVSMENAERGVASVKKRLERNVTKGRMTAESKESALSTLSAHDQLAALADCDLLI